MFSDWLTNQIWNFDESSNAMRDLSCVIAYHLDKPKLIRYDFCFAKAERQANLERHVS